MVAPMPRAHALNPAAQLEVRIEDVSKHGTFVNRELVGRGNSRFLYPEDYIRLGVRVTAHLIPIVLVLAIAPELTDAGLESTLDACVRIGALVVEDPIPAPLTYYQEHTNCVGFLYVAEEGFSMEETMMTALGYGYTLVTPHYLTTLAKRLCTHDTLMPSEFPAPISPSPASMVLRSVHYRRPAQTFFSVTEFLSYGRPGETVVFRGYTFVVLHKAVEEVYGEVLRRFGGVVEMMAIEEIESWKSRQTQSAPLPLTTVVLVGEADFLRLSEEVLEYLSVPSGDGARSLSDAPQILACYRDLYNFGVCLIPEENIHLAFYRNDVSELNTKATACYLQRTTDNNTVDAAPQIDAEAATATDGDHASGEVNVDSNVGHCPQIADFPAAEQFPLPSQSSFASEPFVGSRETSLAHEPYLNGKGEASSSSVPALDMTTAAAKVLAAAEEACTIAEEQERRCSSSGATNTDSTAPMLSNQQHLTVCISSDPIAAGAAEATKCVLDSATADLPGTGVPPMTISSPVASNSSSLEVNAPNFESAPTAPKIASSLLVSEDAVGGANSAPPPQVDSSAPLVSLDKSAGDTALPTASPSEGLTSVSVTQGRRMLSARRYTHPFSLSRRARRSIGDSSEGNESYRFRIEGEESEAEQSTAMGEAETIAGEESGVYCNARPRHHDASARVRRTGSLVQQSGRGHPPTLLPWRNEDAPRPGPRMNSTPRLSHVQTTREDPDASDARQPPVAMQPSPESRSAAASEVKQKRDRIGIPPGSSNGAASSASSFLPISLAHHASLAEVTMPYATEVLPLPLRGGDSQGSIRPTVSSTPSAAVSSAKQHVADRTSSSSGSLSARATSNELTSGSMSIRRGARKLAGVSASAERPAQMRQAATSGSNDGISGNASLSRRLLPGSERQWPRRTSEQELVVCTASQVGPSPPRQRVTGVHIGTVSAPCVPSPFDVAGAVAPLPSASEGEREAPTSPTYNGRCSVRRESSSGISNGPPSEKSAPKHLPRSSSSYRRADSTQLREMITPHRLLTPRTSTSALRRTHTQELEEVTRSRSSGEHPREYLSRNNSAGGTSENYRNSTSGRRSSTRRRRGNSPQGSDIAVGQAPSAPYQIPSGGSTGMAQKPLSARSALEESHTLANGELRVRCEKFINSVLESFTVEVERTALTMTKQAFMDTSTKETFEEGLWRLLEFLQYVNRAETEIPAMYSTSDTRVACHQVRLKAQCVLSKIKACYKTLNCPVPPVLIRARAALGRRVPSSSSSHCT